MQQQQQQQQHQPQQLTSGAVADPDLVLLGGEDMADFVVAFWRFLSMVSGRCSGLMPWRRFSNSPQIMFYVQFSVWEF